MKFVEIFTQTCGEIRCINVLLTTGMCSGCLETAKTLTGCCNGLQTRLNTTT